MTATSTAGSTLAEDAETEFALDSLTGPAVVAGERLSIGSRIQHAEYGLLEVCGYGFTNGALGKFLKLAPVEDTGGDVPSKWSLDCGAPNSLPDAFAANEIAVADADRRSDG